MRSRSVLRCACLAAQRGRINIIVTDRSRNVAAGLGPGSRSARNTNRALRFTSRVRFIRESEPGPAPILRPLLGGFLDVGAGGLRSARKIDQIRQNVQGLVALRIK